MHRKLRAALSYAFVIAWIGLIGGAVTYLAGWVYKIWSIL